MNDMDRDISGDKCVLWASVICFVAAMVILYLYP